MTTSAIATRERGSRLGAWRQLLRFARPYRRSLIGLMVTGAVFALIEATLPWLLGRIIDRATSSRPMISWLFAYGALLSIIPLLIWSLVRLAGRVATGFAHDLRQAAFSHLQHLHFGFYDERPSGWLIARLTSDCSRLASTLPWCLLDFTWGPFVLMGAITMMLILEAGLALGVLALLPAFIATTIWFQRRLIRSQREMRKNNSRLTAAYNEGLMGVLTTKMLAREDAALAEFAALSDAQRSVSIRNLIESTVYVPVITGLVGVGVGIVLWRGGSALPLDISLGTLVAFIQLAGLLAQPVREMAQRFTQLQAAQASAERLQGLLEVEPAIRDSEAVRARRAPRLDPAERIRSVELRDLGFAYHSGQPVLSNIDLEVAAGETVALVGATGSGKTSLVHLLARFYEPTAGHVLIDGIDYRDIPLAEYQARLGVVPQTAQLFQGSVRENIRYGRIEASDEEVEQAARVVQAHGVLSELDQGFDTEVGEGGSRISSGQRQLIALARVVLADPDILILDEATSSVDTETERLLQIGIERTLAGRIGFLIAHRLSTVRFAQRIVVLDHGRIVETGTHEELLARGGWYSDLWSRQVG